MKGKQLMRKANLNKLAGYRNAIFFWRAVSKNLAGINPNYLTDKEVDLFWEAKQREQHCWKMYLEVKGN